MRKFISILGVFLLSLGGSNLLIADDDFEIKLIDDSSKSGLKQKHIEVVMTI